MTRKTGYGRVGFTLIELLVVIAIIAILAAMLMPALERARAAARTVACSNKLHQLYIGVTMYENEYGLLPPHRYTNYYEIVPGWDSPEDQDCDGWGDWWFGISALWPFVERVEIFHCPEDDVPSWDVNPRVCGRLGPPACNSGLEDWDVGFSYWGNNWGHTRNKFLSMSRRPTNIIWMHGHPGGFVHQVSSESETDYYGAANGYIVPCEDYGYIEWHNNRHSLPPTCWVTKRHMGRFNTLALNGAVTTFVWGNSTREDWHE